MSEKQEPMADEEEKSKYDAAWKNVIRKLFEQFLEFFYPKIFKAIDFSKGVQFLDKELKDIKPAGNQGDRVADVLAKVHLKDGTVNFIAIVIHIEVQGDRRTDFMKRMFIYYYRAFDNEAKKDTPVISLALLTDDEPNYKPNQYHFGLLGFDIRMKVPVAKILDYTSKKTLTRKLETSKNPMSMIVRAQLKSHEVKRAGNNRKFEATKELIRQCYGYGYSQERTRIILDFFDLVIRLPKSFEQEIQREILKVEEELNMEYTPTWLRESERIGREKGRDEGREEEKLANARAFLEEGVSIDVIAKCTGMTEVKLRKLLKLPQVH
ncbi:MAG: hypothetical protein GY765_02285 [bacterium]|nr:hypothetical protein [bacterium]